MTNYETQICIKKVFKINSQHYGIVLAETGHHAYQAKFAEGRHVRSLAKSMNDQVCRLCGLCSGPKVGLTFKPEHPFKLYAISYSGNVFTSEAGALCAKGVTIKIKT